MHNRIALAFSTLALVAAVPAAAQTPPAPPPAAPAPQADLVHVRLDTAKGAILLALDRGRAPATNPFVLTNASGTQFRRADKRFETHSANLTASFRF